jgi:hypothetical protein
MKTYFINTLICSFVATTLLGCSTTEIKQSEAIQAPSSRIYKFQTPSSNTGKIIITRDEGFTSGGTCYYAVWINGELATKLDTKEYVTLHLNKGEHIIKVSREPNTAMGWWCGMESADYSQIETVIKENDIKYFRLSIQLNGKAIIQRQK